MSKEKEAELAEAQKFEDYPENQVEADQEDPEDPDASALKKKPKRKFIDK